MDTKEIKELMHDIKKSDKMSEDGKNLVNEEENKELLAVHGANQI